MNRELMPSYIVFHPDRQRKEVEVKAEVLRGNRFEKNWSGHVWIDSTSGNEDPWVHAMPWMYSYCHATQLKRSVMGAGDIILFVSGDSANECVLKVDTVFVVRERHDWANGKPPATLLKKYPKSGEGWKRHLKYGVSTLKCSEHTGKHTFESQGYNQSPDRFSYLPLSRSGKSVSIDFDELPSSISQKVRRKTDGKYPVELTTSEADRLYQKVLRLASIKVVRISELVSYVCIMQTASCGCKRTLGQA